MRSLDAEHPDRAKQPLSRDDNTVVVAELRTQVRRLAERLERVEDKVELMGDVDSAPLSWPVSVDTESKLEVPPLNISRANSPAFDVLLGPSRVDPPRRDTA